MSGQQPGPVPENTAVEHGAGQPVPVAAHGCGTTGSQLTVADILTGGTVRIVAAKYGSEYAAETVTVLAASTSGQTG